MYNKHYFQQFFFEIYLIENNRSLNVKFLTKIKILHLFLHHVEKTMNGVLTTKKPLFEIIRKMGRKKDMNNFIERYADSIICEPSGLTYNQLKETKIQKMMIINQNNF